MKVLKGRFEKETDLEAHAFNSSIGVDFRLYEVDIKGSLVHSEMLFRQGIISKEDFEKITKGLLTILKDIKEGALTIDYGAEDIHMFVEEELTKRVGDAGKRLHTSRSRNDQVALDVKLYTREKCKEIIKLLFNLEDVLIDLAKDNLDTIMPGYTHLQIAQPVTLAHHLMAYVQMIKRDIERFKDAYLRMSTCPLGAGALATTTYNIDRDFTAKNLGFDSPTLNSMDSVSDRDHVLEILFNISTFMMHLSRFSEEIILFASQEFAFISLDEAYSTGSSIMPQKKNPDMAELIRGKCARVYGNLNGAMTMLKGIPLCYNKDMQEDKVYLFDSVDTCILATKVFMGMVKTMKPNIERMNEMAHKGFINATDMADYLVKKGLAFRDAYKITGELVRYCIDKSKSLNELDLSELKTFSPLFEEDVYKYIDLNYILAGRKIFGGPAPEAVKKQIEITEGDLKKLKKLVD
ncbi:argininosuccinate lyase [Peptoniphilus catoniae]|uniref:argininosuccinate lyase n=1 Tax=Peptoniphilus catoniae TaxID=1660341 RepID=UPI0010FD9327|nr:argininosuccinate lyase [Peptoniphilus catoniae]